MLKNLFLLISGFSFLFIIPIFAETLDDGKLFYDALQLSKEKKINSALVKVREYLATNPNNFAAKTNECSYLLELNQLTDAEKCLGYTLKAKPDDLANLNNLGMLYALRGDYQSAKTQFSIIHQNHPDDVTSYANLLASQVMLGDNVDEILVEYQSLLNRDEFNIQVLTNIGKILNDKHELEKAKLFLDRAYDLDSKDVNALEQLGVWYGLKGDLQNAEKYFLKALDEDHDNVSVLNNLGLLNKDLGDKFKDISYYEKSIQYYNSVLIHDKENEFAHAGIEYSQQKINEINFAYLKLYVLIGIPLATAMAVILFLFLRYRQLNREQDSETELTRYQQILSSKLMIIVLLGILGIPLVLVIISSIFNIRFTSGSDVANWTAMVVEVGIGTIVSALILTYDSSEQSRFRQKQTEISNLISDTREMTQETRQMVDKVKKMVTSTHNFSQSRKRGILY